MTEAASPSTDASAVDHVILIPSSKFAWSICPSAEAAEAKIAELKRDDPARFGDATTMTLDAFVARREAAYLDTPIVEITEDRFSDALDCLPPLDYERGEGVCRFCMSEFTDGSITQQYAQLGDRYFTKPVRFRDRATYLSRDLISAALEAGTVRRDADSADPSNPPDEEVETCSDCAVPLNEAGDGYDGRCPTCADRADAST